ncbi:MAG: OmpA family protein [Saprospiraceae bacterium]|nr:OmpA family protein [Saprospiraceae bacterium]
MMFLLSRKTNSVLLFLFFSSALFAQLTDRQVTRCGAVSRSAPVRNIFVDNDNSKWVASGAGVFKVQACDLSTPLELAPGELSPLMFPRGNADVRWTTDILQMTIGSAPEITAAFYDSRNDWLWLGTRESGLFQLKTKPALKLVQKFTSGNSKLKSNHITAIHQDRVGRYWIGSDLGMIIGAPDKWKADLEGYDVQRIREYGPDVYVLADGEFWLVSGGEKWQAIRIKEKALEGEAEDFDIDPTNGNLWILSRMISYYDLQTDEYQAFSGAEYYTSEYGRCLSVDQDGAVWVGTDDKGLYLIDKSSNLVINCVVDQPISCEGNGQDAVLHVRVSGGKEPFSYAWSDPKLQGATPKNVGAGSYTVTVTDAGGKSKSGKTKVEDPRFTVALEQKKAESEPGAKDGSAEVRTQGGAPAFRYAWDNGETTNPATRLTGGSHAVTVTDNNGCKAIGVISISQKLAPLSVTIAESTPIPCAGGNTMLQAAVSGGKAPYQYEWSQPRMTDAQPSGVTAGTYTLTVVDAAGGKTVSSITVVQPSALSALATAVSPAGTGASDGKATAAPRGGTSPYAYKWDNGETTEQASRLSPGQHSVTVTDANGCTISAKVTITENILPLNAAVEETGQINCYGGQTGLQVNVTGGKMPYEFKWSNPALVGFQPGGVAAGVYTVTVTDAAGGRTTTVFTVKQPAELSASASLEAPASTASADGRATVQANGGTPPYQFRWDNDETGERNKRLSPGQHTITVTDVYGCSATTTVDMTENILPLSARIEQTGPINCNGGATGLRVKVSGGKEPFQYQWSLPSLQGNEPQSVPAGTYQLVVIDAAGGRTSTAFQVQQPERVSATAQQAWPAAAGVNNGKASLKVSGGAPPYLYQWDSEETGSEAVRLGAGEHRFTVTDNNGCSATGTVQISENIMPLAATLAEIAPINCNEGQTGLRATVSGGKPPYQYQWNAAGLSGDQPAGVPAGAYTVTITDASGKVTQANVIVKEPDPITLSVTIQAQATAGNADGKARVLARGGNGAPFKYQWDNGETGEAATRLGPGAHRITVTDARGCTLLGVANISENILPLEVNVEETGDIKCAGETSGLKVQVSGGKPPYQYKWDNPAWTGPEVNNVPAATYAVLVTDAQGTTQTAVAIVNAPDALTVDITRVVGATTERSADGKATVKISGGTPPMRIAWDNGETTATAFKLNLGAHVVTVTDANGCSLAKSLEIKQRILPELNAALLRSGQTIRMEQLRFEADSSSLTTDALPTLDELYDFMEENGNIVIEIGGHTNSTPPDEFCDRLSTARAKSAADYLIGKGVDPKRVVFKGYGKRQPVASNATAEGRRMNQRVEIKILTLKRE